MGVTAESNSGVVVKTTEVIRFKQKIYAQDRTMYSRVYILQIL